MDYRGLFLMGACLAAGTSSLLGGCKGPDPGAIQFQEREGDNGVDKGSSGNTSSGTSGAGTSGAVATDGGAEGGASGDFFHGEAFAFNAMQNIDGITHGATAEGTAPMEGKECAKNGCHGDGTAGAPKWGGAGSVYDTGGAAFPTALQNKVQIRINDATGAKWCDMFPDNQGNFYCEDKTEPPPAGAKVAIRTDTGAVLPMVTPLVGGQPSANCNGAGCHDGKAQARITAK